MAAPRPGNPDRGWNDPPMFDYQGWSSGTAGGAGSQHHKLNKRVAYPMSHSSEAATDTSPLLNPSDGPPCLPPVQILPPSSTTTTPTPIPLLVPSLSPTSDPSQPTIFSPPPQAGSPAPASAAPAGSTSASIKVKDLSCVLSELSLDTEATLLEYVHEGLEAASIGLKETLKARTSEDIKKKLSLMQEWWTSGKICPEVKSQMGSLVAALNKQELEAAHEIHLALMINHTTEVNQWLVAVKHIIQELRTKVPGSQVNQSEGQVQPIFVDSASGEPSGSSGPVTGENDLKCRDTTESCAADSKDSEMAAGGKS